MIPESSFPRGQQGPTGQYLPRLNPLMKATPFVHPRMLRNVSAGVSILTVNWKNFGPSGKPAAGRKGSSTGKRTDLAPGPNETGKEPGLNLI